MVIKPRSQRPRPPVEFESSVISYGNQTHMNIHTRCESFESSVISYGNQTRMGGIAVRSWFESSVSYRYDKR